MSSSKKIIQNGYKHFIKKGTQLPPQRDRYHLYISLGCPWGHRTAIVRKLKGLEDVIGISIFHPTSQKTKPDDPNDSHVGWAFSDKPLPNSLGNGSFDPHGAILDPVYNAKYLRDIYEISNDTTGKYHNPMIFDKQNKQILNNESQDIMEMLNSEFNDFAKNPQIDLNPQSLIEEQQKFDSDISSKISFGVYSIGLAESQEASDKASNELFDYLDNLEELLGNRTFLTGDTFTFVDIKLWISLVRFDEVYAILFRYCKTIYHIEGIKETLNMKQIIVGYYSSFPQLNPHGIIPIGCGFEKILQQQ